ncbi:MAG: type VI secretion protein [Blastocatellia bacterium AA13]|nr:MAG: type VI secretion protein [Blastocatellia bacterium AA13]
MPPAARVIDLHQCPMSTPVGPVQIPHVGGPILGPGVPTVLIAGLPAAKVGDLAFCIGPPDALVKGSQTVKIGGMPAARMGDKTAHGGTIILGWPLVLIGG